ncbi:hypothetical protein M405DRAFT_883307 [Rhizopogon salebrosus TDB-379]|nr:hypothetical protein M405DRAFT_883307 [Rhizopogon salebrosus TDB-379]
MHENLIIDEPAIAHCDSFGFTALQTTLLSCIPGVVEIVTIFTGVRLAARRPNSRAYVGAAYFVPSWLGILLVNLLPWSDKYLSGVSTPGFVPSLSWLNSVTAGHTKRVVTNAIMLSAYCISNSAGPLCGNHNTSREPVDDNEEEYVIERITEDGKRVEVKVDKDRDKL